MENDIRKYEKEALAFGKEIFADELADAVYITTMGSCQYFGPVFPDERFSKKLESFYIVRTDGKYDFLPSSKLKFENEEEERSFKLAQGNWWDYLCAFMRSYKEGMAKEKKAIARKLKANGYPVADITYITELTPEEIKNL